MTRVVTATRRLAAAVLSIVPSHAEFIAALGVHDAASHRVHQDELRRWVDAARPLLHDLDAFFRSVRLEG